MTTTHSIKLAIGVTLVLPLCACDFSFGGGPSGPVASGPAATAPADMTFEQQGNTYVVVNGDIYLQRPDGSRQFVERFYDPNFRAVNYIQKDGSLHQRDPSSNESYAVTRHFEEGFEGVSKVEELIAVERWHRYNTDQAQAGKDDNFYNIGNTISISRERKHSGDASLRLFAKADSSVVSKAAVAKNIMYFEKGDHVWFSGWFFIEDVPSIVDGGAFTIMDLESTFMQYVGMRIILRTNDSLAFELKMPKTSFDQEPGREIRFPTERWVNVKSHLYLSDTDGHIEIWQDGQKVLDQRGPTLPVADAIYDNLELGITAVAKGSRYDKVMYVDDVVISNKPLAR